MDEYIGIGLLVVLVLYQGWLNYEQRKGYEARINNLLDRLMAKEYPTYIQGEVAKEQVKRPLTAEEIYELSQERGIPV